VFLKRFPELRSCRVLLFLGRFDPKKGARMLVPEFCRIAKERPELRLVMVGPDNTPEAESLRGLVPVELRDRVVWTGMLLGAEKWGAFRAAEAFVIPSHTENYCIAAVEALACGLPVLMSDRVNIHPMVCAHRAGYVEPDTEQGCARLLGRWLATGSEEWAEMRKRARACFLAEFGAEDAYRRYRSALLSIYGGGAAAHPLPEPPLPPHSSKPF